jgi:hypothetical protein
MDEDGNIEQGISNFEVKEQVSKEVNFDIPCSIFDIQKGPSRRNGTALLIVPFKINS